MVNDEEQAIQGGEGVDAGRRSAHRVASPGDELVGFAQVACFIARDKEHSSSVYRGYEKLAARNLLHMQSELRELEHRLDIFDRKDAQGGVDSFTSAMDWPLLQDGTQNAGESERK